jgi:2-polyprenyl-3-methyl-5-hydroxy-6-metoxy-1,4-benzoquinol methylase
MMLWRREEKRPAPAKWPLSLPAAMTGEEVEAVRRRVEELAARAQYGWGHTISFGPFTKEGVMKDKFLHTVGHWDAWGWWPKELKGLRVADVGCLTGGITMIAAHRGAAEVLAVDEVAEHVDQCAYLAEVFGMKNVQTLTGSLFELPDRGVGEFDLVILSGVLYHLSDMLVGLYVMRELLKVGGTVLIESAAVDDDEHSYANFGRFAMGMWWQPSRRCIRDMCEFMGLSEVEVRMYLPDRCFARARKTSKEAIPFRRGLHYHFADLRDGRPRSMNLGEMAPR